MISIVVPIYNVEKYICQCVDSIISSKYDNIEIILVDDGSVDKCPKICDDYALKDNRIKVIHKANGGLISARKAGVNVSHGEYVTFVDGDDFVHQNMYEDVAKSIEKHNSDVVICDFYYDYGNRKDVSQQICIEEFYDKTKLVNEIYPKMLFDGNYYSFGIAPNCWSKVFKKDLLVKYLMEVDDSTKMGEDASFTYPILLDANSISYVNKPLYYYRILPQSMSRGYDKNLNEIIFNAYYTIKKCANNDFDISSQLAYYMVYLANFVVRNQIKSNDKSKTNNFVKQLLANIDLINSAKKLEVCKLPIHTKIFVCGLRCKSKIVIKIYMAILKKIIRLKV